MLLEPTATGHAEIVVKRSRFVATAAPATTVAAAESHVAETRAAHPHASHVVFAYLVGDPNSEHAGMSDAGEPKGTAARPVMDHLRGSGLRDIVVTVTRYFGGTELGTGGLVRAYGGAAAAALEATPRRERIERVSLVVRLAYQDLDRVTQTLEAHDAQVTGDRFGVDIELSVALPAHQLPSLESTIQDQTRGRAQIGTIDGGDATAGE